jgi:hypothetical protein
MGLSTELPTSIHFGKGERDNKVHNAHFLLSPGLIPGLLQSLCSEVPTQRTLSARGTQPRVSGARTVEGILLASLSHSQKEMGLFPLISLGKKGQ